MSTKNNASFNVIVEARRRGDTSEYWDGKLLPVQSQWDQGSEQEKFEVLCAIRKIYNPDERRDIRGSTGQTPSQIGQSEGFTRLQYRHTESLLALTVIVKLPAGYRQLVPLQKAAENAPASHRNVRMTPA